MRNRRKNVAVLGVVKALKGLDCDSARGEFAALNQHVDLVHRQLAAARHVESQRSASVQKLLRDMPTFDPLVFRSGVASFHAAQRASRSIEARADSLRSERDVAREQLLHATAGHEVIKKEYRKSVGKLTRSLAQESEYAREDRFAASQRSSHVGFRFSV